MNSKAQCNASNNNDQKNNAETRTRNYHSLFFMLLFSVIVVFTAVVLELNLGWAGLGWTGLGASKLPRAANAKMRQSYFLVGYFKIYGVIFDSTYVCSAHICCGNRHTHDQNQHNITTIYSMYSVCCITKS